MLEPHEASPQKNEPSAESYRCVEASVCGVQGLVSTSAPVHSEHAELVVFQLNKDSGSFVVEIAKFNSEKVRSHWRADISLDNVTVYEAAERHRLGASIEGDKWLVFGKPTNEPDHELVEPESHYLAVSELAATLLASEAEQWWGSSNHSFKRPAFGGRGIQTLAVTTETFATPTAP